MKKEGRRRRGVVLALFGTLAGLLAGAALATAFVVAQTPLATESNELPPGPGTIAPSEALGALNWLLGTWDFDYGEFVLHRQIERSEGGNFIVFHDEMLGKDGRRAFRELKIVAYNPISELFETWSFRDTGGFGGGVLEQFGTQWIAPVRMILSDGRTATSNNIYTPLEGGGFTWKSVSRTLEGLALPDLPPVAAKKVESGPDERAQSFLF